MSTDHLLEIATLNASHAVLSGGGEMGVLMRSIDWAATSLGSPDTWPDHLRSALSLCLNAQFPMAIYWGPELTLLYNDAWRPIAGDKHPWSMGRPAVEVWSEIWEAIDPLFQTVYQTGEGTFSSDQLLLMHRHGYTEECYFDFTFSPIKDLNGNIGGILNVVQETTYRVINDRRARLLREVASLTSSRTSVEEVCNLAIEAIATDPHDIPFALLYQLNAQEEQAVLVGATGLSVGTPASPLQIDLHHQDQAAVWPIAEVLQSGQPINMVGFSERCDAHFIEALSEIPKEVIVLPVMVTGQGDIAGVLIAGVSPRRILDENYSDFYELVVGHIGTAIASAKILEEERKRAEALAEIDRAKTAFFSSVSHEFRTPLTLMLGPLEDALEDPDTDARTQARLNLAHRNALRLQKLVNTLLDFSRIEAAKVQASYQPTDVSSYTAELASMFQSAVEKAALTLEIDCPKLSDPIYIDRDMWEKIVLNLLSNAFKYTFNGEIAVSLKCTEKEVQLIVRDTGIGIPPHELPHLFERFHRVANARSRTHEGSGIGLAMVQELVKLHGGTISVVSRVDQGTTFTVSIPTGKAHLPADRIEASSVMGSTAIAAQSFVDEALRWLPDSEEKHSRPVSSTESWQGASLKTEARARIILADDNADMRDYVCSLLEPYCDVEAVSDGAKALAAAQREMPDLVLSDVMMPEMDGFELLNALRADSNLRNIPIILLSARAGEEARVEGLQAGADDYLTKPFSARELLARVKVNLDLHRVRWGAVQREKLALDITDSIRTELDLDSILEKTVNHLGQLTQADRCAVWLYNPKDNHFQAPRFEYRSNDQVVPITQTADPTTPALPLELSDREVIQYSDILQAEGLTEQDHHRIKERGIKSLLHVPILYRDQLMGTLRVHTVFEYRQWDDETISLLYYLGAQVAIAIYHAQLLKQLRETEARKSAIFESSLDAITTMDAHGKVVDWNPAAEGLFGYTQEEAIGQDVAVLMIPERFRQVYYQGLSHYLATGEAPVMDRVLEMPALRKDGTEFLSELIISCVLIEEVPLFTGTLRDITARKQAEEALRASEAQFRTLSNALPQIVWTANADGHVDWYNERWYEFTGQPREGVRDQHWESILYPDDLQLCRDTWYSAVQSGQLYQIEYRFKDRATGGWRWFLGRALPLRDENDKIVKWFGTCTDIHDQKLTEAALQESESRFRNMADASQIMIATSDETRAATYFNKAWTDITGRSMETLIDFGWVDLLHPDDRQGYLDTYFNAFAKKEAFTGEFRLLNKEGEYRWILAMAPPRLRPDGSLAGYISSCVDITDRKQMEEALRGSEARLRAIMDATSDCIKIVAADGTLQYMNKSGHVMLEADQPEAVFVGTDARNFIAPEYREQWVRNHNRICGGESLDWEFEMIGVKGTRRWVETHAVPLPGLDGSFAQLAITRDATERQRQKAQLQRAFERERLIRRIVEFTTQTFDINSLLNIVAAEIGKFFMADRCFIIRYTEEGGYLNVSVHGQYYRSQDLPAIDMTDFSPEIMRAFTHNLPIENVMRLQKCNTQAEYTEDLRTRLDDYDYIPEAEKVKYSEYFRDILVDKYCIHAVLKTGIQYRNIPFGTIMLQQCYEDRYWTDEEVDLLQDIATQIGVAFYQNELYHQEQEAAEREVIVRKFIQTVHSASNLEDKFQDLCNELGKYLQADHVFIARYDAQLQELFPPTREYRSSDDVPSLLQGTLEAISEKSNWILEEMCTSSKPFNFDNDTPGLSEDTKEYLTQQKVQSGLGIAIKFDVTCLAILFIHQVQCKREWTDEEKAIIEAVARQAAIATFQADLLQNEQKARREAEEANLKKSEFLAMMSHELRTPLNAILGYSRMIENGMGGPLTDKQTKYISGVCLSGAHLLNLVNDLLDVSKAEAGKMVISPGLIEVASIVAEVQSMMVELAAKKNISIRFQLDSNANRLEADPARFKQILINLISNAIKFNHPGGSVYVNLYQSEDGEWLIGEVQDTGIGIPKEKQAELFKKFYQVDNTAARSQEGTGLGLALTKELVELHGGEIWVESEVGAGSTFRFKFPLKQCVLNL